MPPPFTRKMRRSVARPHVQVVILCASDAPENDLGFRLFFRNVALKLCSFIFPNAEEKFDEKKYELNGCWGCLGAIPADCILPNFSSDTKKSGFPGQHVFDLSGINTPKHTPGCVGPHGNLAKIRLEQL